MMKNRINIIIIINNKDMDLIMALAQEHGLLVVEDAAQAIDAFYKLSRYEGIIPALESSHAVAYAMKLAKEIRTGSILVNLSGRGDKDVDYVIEHYGFGEDHLF